LRIVTDLPALARIAPLRSQVRCFPMGDASAHWRRCFRMLLASIGSDYLVIRFSLPEVIFFCAALSFIPGCCCRVVTLDLFVEKLVRAPALVRSPVSWALRRVHKFLVFFKDSHVFEKALSVPPDKFCYIPYKINGFERVRAAATSDDGYIFCGGRSRRDFVTFFAAVEGLGCPVKVITAREGELNVHGSSLLNLKVPPNVELLQSNPSLEFFIDTVSRARLVVLPIIKGTLTQTGIGVYLIAMALRKCVIVSSGLGISDVLNAGQAMIVPAGDVEALQEAIERAWNDPDLRERYADTGWRYAVPLGGEDQLAESVLGALAGPARDS
jgi:glycosyltransferase involved in cell wall biosynthesis